MTCSSQRRLPESLMGQGFMVRELSDAVCMRDCACKSWFVAHALTLPHFSPSAPAPLPLPLAIQTVQYSDGSSASSQQWEAMFPIAKPRSPGTCLAVCERSVTTSHPSGTCRHHGPTIVRLCPLALGFDGRCLRICKTPLLHSQKVTPWVE